MVRDGRAWAVSGELAMVGAGALGGSRWRESGRPVQV